VIAPAPADLERGSSAGSWINRPAARLHPLPCPQSPRDGEPECRIVDGPWDGETIGTIDFDSPGWVASSLPPAGKLEGPWGEMFQADPLLTFHAQHNARVESAWCRRRNGKSTECLSSRAGIEFHGDWSAVDLRSRSGQFIFYNLGQEQQFQVFDVLNLRVVTPESPRLTVHRGAGVFSDHPDDRLFVVSDGRLHVFEPDQDTGEFVDLSNDLSWNRLVKRGNAGDTIVGVITGPSDSLILITEGGLMTRLEWQTGVTVWSRGAPGIGPVRFVRRSPAGDHFVVGGTDGLRLVRSRDGLLRSGILVPPYILEPTADVTGCSERGSTRELIDVMSDVSVDAGPQVVVRCGPRRLAWQPMVLSGDRRERLAELRIAARDREKIDP